MSTRRVFLGGALTLFGSACSMPPALRRVEQGFRVPYRNPDAYPLSVEQLQSFPTGALAVRLGDAPVAVMAFARRQQQGLRWVSADRVIFITQSGVLVHTRGLRRDLAATRWLLPNPLLTGAVARLGGKPRVYRRIDLRRGADVESGVDFESSFEVLGEETIHLLGGEYRTHHILERVDVSAWRWGCDNHYWVETTSGEVRRSLQRFCPEVEPIRLELLKAPGE